MNAYFSPNAAISSRRSAMVLRNASVSPLTFKVINTLIAQTSAESASRHASSASLDRIILSWNRVWSRTLAA
jgi:hypothetical protein